MSLTPLWTARALSRSRQIPVPTFRAASSSTTAAPTHFHITLLRSSIGLPSASRDTLAALGLHDKLHRSVLHPFSPTCAGQILKVKELVSVQNVTEAEGLELMSRTSKESRGWEEAGRAYGGGKKES